MCFGFMICYSATAWQNSSVIPLSCFACDLGFWGFTFSTCTLEPRHPRPLLHRRSFVCLDQRGHSVSCEYCMSELTLHWLCHVIRYLILQQHLRLITLEIIPSFGSNYFYFRGALLLCTGLVSKAYKNRSAVLHDTPTGHVGHAGHFIFIWNYLRCSQQQKFSVEISLAGPYISLQLTDGHFGEFYRVVIPLAWSETHSLYDSALCSFVDR